MINDFNKKEEKDFELSSHNILRTDKNFSIKNKFNVNDTEMVINHGQKFKRTAFSTLVWGSIYSVSSSDFLIGVTSLSYSPSIGLPKPRIVGIGKNFIVKDEVGGAATTTITIRSSGEETIDGGSSSTIITNYGVREFYTDGVNWFTK